jgi:hypothetical protein
MKLYVNYRKKYPNLDKFLHLVARLVFALIAFIGVTAFILTVILRDAASSSGLLTKFGEDGTLVWNMEFFGIVALVGIIVAFGAFMTPNPVKFQRKTKDGETDD